MSNPLRIQVFQDKSRRKGAQWNYRFVRSGNVLNTGRGYNRKADAKRAALDFVKGVWGLPFGFQKNIEILDASDWKRFVQVHLGPPVKAQKAANN